MTIVLTTSTFIATGIIRVELPRASKSSEEILKSQTIQRIAAFFHYPYLYIAVRNQQSALRS